MENMDEFRTYIKNKVDKIDKDMRHLDSWAGSEFGYKNGTEGNVYRHLNRINDSVKDLVKNVSIQNGRVGKLEKWQAFVMGVVAVICIFIIPVSIRVISSLLM